MLLIVMTPCSSLSPSASCASWASLLSSVESLLLLTSAAAAAVVVVAVLLMIVPDLMPPLSSSADFLLFDDLSLPLLIPSCCFHLSRASARVTTLSAAAFLAGLLRPLFLSSFSLLIH